MRRDLTDDEIAKLSEIQEKEAEDDG